MEYITYFTYIALSGFLNRTRGVDIISRTTFIIINILLSYVLYRDITLALISGIGILLWLMKAWGKYFIAFNPIMDVYKSKKKGVRFIDKIVDKVYKVPTNDKELMNWGTIAMGLRGSIFSIPLFTALAIYYNTWWIGLFFLPMLLQGVYYRGVTRYNFKYAEMLTGYTYSGLIVLSYLIGR